MTERTERSEGHEGMPSRPGMTAGADRLLDLLPAHVRLRDAQTGDTLRALLGAVAGELAMLEGDLAALYDSWFVETCPEWVVPYLADLVGLDELPPDLGDAATRRAVVANTVGYRRRKGTVAVLEQVARDVTGWPARAVEYFPLLTAATHVNHVRLDRPATVDLRDADRLDLVSGPLDPFAHTAEARRIASRRGRYGIPNVGVFLFPARVYPVGSALALDGWSRARPVGDGYAVDPLGRSTPLFAPPTAEEAIERLAAEPALPVPLRPRRLLALLRAARAGALDPLLLPIGVRIGTGAPLPPDRVRVCGLEDLAPVAGQPQVYVDAVSGRLRFHLGGSVHRPARVSVRYAYGGLADIGAGTYDRTEVHENALATDLYSGGPGVGGQVAVRDGAVSSTMVVGTVADGLRRAEQEWARPGGPVGRTFVVSVTDSGSYAEPLAVEIPAETRLVLVAATWPERRLPGDGRLPPVPGEYAPDGLRPHLGTSLTVTGGPGSSLILDGFLLDGDLLVQPGRLGALTVSQCTVAGVVRVAATGDASNRDLRVAVVRSIVDSLDLAGPVPLVSVVDSVLDPGLVAALPRTRARRAFRAAASGAAVTAPGAHLSVEGSTLLGSVGVRSIDASSAMLVEPARAEHRQTGCVRYSYVAPGSRVPRRFHCVPAAEGDAGPRPVFATLDPGAPFYAALAMSCPAEIAAGGEDESEMGAHHHLRRPLRLRAAERMLQPYMPVGLEIGIFGS
ncbi:MAG TPA: phage tail protein [Actinoplanes sp.]|nr:phage tail protein [Actinoplanes sp.]